MYTPSVFQLPLAVPFWVIFFFAFVREAKVVFPAMADSSSPQDAGTFRTIMVGSSLALLVGIAASFLPWLAIASPILAPIAGTALIVAGAALRRYCFYALGSSFTGVVVVKQDQQVIQSGLYRYVRHPSYSAAILMFVGIGLALQSWLSLGILFIAHYYLYGKRVAVEERALLSTLGDPYAQYMQRTKRFIPFII